MYVTPPGSGTPPIIRKIAGRSRLKTGSMYWSGLSDSPPRSLIV